MAAETCADGMSLGFAKYLAAAARVDRIATVSETAAVEYEGWRRMLAGTGLSGPEIRAIPNAAEARASTAADVEAARQLMSVGSLPVVLTVGSHEPRKNHLPLLHAAETLWREGLEFTLTFIGGNSWNSDLFTERVAELQRRDRPVQVVLSVSDELLWAAYRVAYCTVFPSIHEGFGLPIAESLACGTPVITSNYGAMREAAEGGGALLVDPRHDADLTAALRRILTDGSLRDRLASEATNTPVRTWDDFAAETWEYFVRPESRN
jgi:glycosyltransferase involved in cell wall biosynthesis